MAGIIGWRRFAVIVLALLLIAGIDIMNEGGLSFSARDAIIGTLGFYMGGAAVSKFAKRNDA
jgi:hypothetical protein